jgi:predicted amidophosphoribosyltransferase
MAKDIYFKNIFKLDTKNIENIKTQHIAGNRTTRVKLIDGKYKIKNIYKKIIRKSKIIIIDDICTTGATLLSCQKSLEYISNDLDIILFSIAH